MLVNIGKAIKDKKTCDVCQQPGAEEVHECVLPGDKHGNFPQYFDLCDVCTRLLRGCPHPYVSLERPLKPLVAQLVLETRQPGR